MRVAQVAGTQFGVLSIDELRACGLSPGAVSVRVVNGRLHRLHLGVYAVGHGNPPLEGHLLAAVKACGPRAVLSHFAAAAVFGIVRWDGRHPEVTVRGTTPRTHPGIRVHRTLALAIDEVTVHDGIPVTAPVRVLVDLAATFTRTALRRAVRQAQSLGLVSLRQLLDALGRHRGRRGIRKLAQIVATGWAPTRSELEDVVLDLMLVGGLAHPQVNRPLILDGRRVIPDFRWPSRRLVVEADGAAWHDNRLAREDDAERDALLEAHGERIVHITWHQAVARPAQTLARLRAAGAPLAHRLSPGSG